MQKTAVEWLISQIVEDQIIKAKSVGEWEIAFQKAQEMDKNNSLKLIELTAQLTGVATVDDDIAKMSYEDVYNQFKFQKNKNG